MDLAELRMALVGRWRSTSQERPFMMYSYKGPHYGDYTLTVDGTYERRYPARNLFDKAVAIAVSGTRGDWEVLDGDRRGSKWLVLRPRGPVSPLGEHLVPLGIGRGIAHVAYKMTSGATRALGLEEESADDGFAGPEKYSFVEIRDGNVVLRSIGWDPPQVQVVWEALVGPALA